jgi:alkanesulfonate monooxygenase SsuD/methylene tetrahydromethanopterin reductase-like flavin-dependent oxidoreductase (luciferase family)
VRFDVFCSIAQTPVDGYMPDEATMYRSFFDQAQAADELGYGTVWVAESHYSSEVQKRHRKPVIAHWRGEVGLNADVCQLAHHVFSRTRSIHVGSAVMNIVCNGGPLAAAERIATFATLHGLDPAEGRRLHVGFSAGRFDFMNRVTGVDARCPWEEAAWPQVKRRLLWEAAEIFVRLLRGDALASDQIPEYALTRSDFPSDAAWERVRSLACESADEVRLPRRWSFEATKVVPAEWRRELVQLVLGSHDAALQEYVNGFCPVRVFNLSITEPAVIEATHDRMRRAYHPDGGPWQRRYMPRTVLVFLDARPGVAAERQRAAARARAQAALAAYWTALEGTLDPARVQAATDYALVGNAEDVAEQILARFHPRERLMLWFDFFDHDSASVIATMEGFMSLVLPRLRRAGVTVG